MLLCCMQLGYLQSWSAHQTYRAQHPERPDPLLEFKQQLLEALGAKVGAGFCNWQMMSCFSTVALQRFLLQAFRLLPDQQCYKHTALQRGQGVSACLLLACHKKCRCL
jgi:hypothetical protein